MAPSRAAAAAGVLGVVIVGCSGASPHRDLQVMAFTPSGSLDAPRPVEIKFDQPVVPVARVGKPVDPTAVELEPATPWKGFWQDRQTLVIEPAALQPSTRYRVALRGELAARTAGFQLAFVYQPLAVEGISGVDVGALAPDAAIPLTFNQPVRPATAAAHCKLVGDPGGPPDVALTATGEPAKTVALAPAHPLARDGSYTLTCEGLTAAGGRVPLEAPYTTAVHARPGLEVTQLLPSGDDVAADQATIELTFSTQVTLDAARKAIASRPAIAGLDQGYLTGDGTGYQVTVDLDSHTAYELTVAGLVDVFGQPLAAPARTAFTTGEARPRLSMQRGIYALEASARGYPVWSRNVHKLALECAQIPRARLVQLLTTDMNYDPWGGNADDQPIDWSKLGATPRTTAIAPAPSQAKRWVENDLALGRLCGGRDRGVFLAELTSDEIVPDPQRGWLTPRRNRVLANVTDLGVLLEVGTASGLVWVTSIASGAPLADAGVTIFTPAGKPVFTGTTGGDGLLRIPGSALLDAQPPGSDPEAAGDWDGYRSQRLIAVVERAGDLAIVDGSWSNGIQTWNFGARGDHAGGVTKLRGFIQSDRGLYRPGETVHFKGLMREVANGRPPRVPGGGPVGVEVTDSRGQVVTSQRAKLSSFGGFAFDLALGAEAALGDYYVAATLGGQVFRERFSVEELRPTAFALGLTSKLAAPRPGDPLGFALAASYLYGAPVAGAKVEWGVRKRAHTIGFPGWEDYSFSSDPDAGWWSYRGRNRDYGELVADGTGETDAQGHLAIDARDDATAFPGPVDYILSTVVTDASDQARSRSTLVTAHQTAFYLGVHANEYVQAVGMPFGVNLVALAPDGTRVATAAHLSFVRTVHQCACGFR